MAAHAHTHDHIDWATRIPDLRRVDDLDAGAYAAIAARLMAAVPAGATVVDVGSGAGGMSAALAVALAARGGGTLLLVDAVPELLAVAAETARAAVSRATSAVAAPAAVSGAASVTAVSAAGVSAAGVSGIGLSGVAAPDAVAATAAPTPATSAAAPSVVPSTTAPVTAASAAAPSAASATAAPATGASAADASSTAAPADGTAATGVSVTAVSDATAAATASTPGAPGVVADERETGASAGGAASATVVIRAIHADVATQDLGDLVPPADLVWAARMVHHLPDQQAGVTGLASALSPGGVLAVAEGGLESQTLPWDLGIGEPGLERRLSAAGDEWFRAMRASMEGAVRMPYGWTTALARAGLTDVSSFTALTDHPAPATDEVRQFVITHFGRLAETVEDRAGDEDRETVRRLLDPSGPDYLGNRDDLYVLSARTVHFGRKL
ncbi:trans-aconitate 2-methyltransferase [Amycolatopsis sp. GM8]|uniref:class I SAM-dependent methyltransferase n=1 Tax=Amycolatopsis sp. GM8 TaxID=2896530 RepID=UPI0027149532|nr:class I SAM-dependent methyltransferase [Amycolatopsis sp. GM8]